MRYRPGVDLDGSMACRHNSSPERSTVPSPCRCGMSSITNRRLTEFVEEGAALQAVARRTFSCVPASMSHTPIALPVVVGQHAVVEGDQPIERLRRSPALQRLAAPHLVCPKPGRRPRSRGPVRPRRPSRARGRRRTGFPAASVPIVIRSTSSRTVLHDDHRTSRRPHRLDVAAKSGLHRRRSIDSAVEVQHPVGSPPRHLEPSVVGRSTISLVRDRVRRTTWLIVHDDRDQCSRRG